MGAAKRMEPMMEAWCAWCGVQMPSVPCTEERQGLVTHGCCPTCLGRLMGAAVPPPTESLPTESAPPTVAERVAVLEREGAQMRAQLAELRGYVAYHAEA